MSTSSMTTLRSFSASVSWRDGVNAVVDTDEVTEPVGLDFRVSWGERQNPVTLTRFTGQVQVVVVVTVVLCGCCCSC